MQKEMVLSVLREHGDELRGPGLLHLSLFGSVARGDATANSDVDLLAEFNPSRKVTLVTVGSLQDRLSALLGREVDLSPSDWLRETVREQVHSEAVLAF